MILKPDVASETESLNEPLYWFTSDENPPDTSPRPMTAEGLTVYMRGRLKFYGTPLPDGFVPPPGLDVDALLKHIPWPPAPDA